jgi:hypothetical protein
MAGSNEIPDVARDRVSRRTLVKAAAWTVPAIVVATASPASAAVSGTIVISNAHGAGSINLLGLTSTNFTVTFGGTSNTVHPVTLTVSTVSGFGAWSNYSGNTGDVKPGDVIHFTAKIQALIAITTTVTVTATFSDGNPVSSAAAPLGLTIILGRGANNNVQSESDSESESESESKSTPTPDPTPTPTPSASTPAP